MNSPFEEMLKPTVLTREDYEETKRECAKMEQTMKSLHNKMQEIHAEWMRRQAQLSLYKGYEMVMQEKNKQIKETVDAIDEADRIFQANLLKQKKMEALPIVPIEKVIEDIEKPAVVENDSDMFNLLD